MSSTVIAGLVLLLSATAVVGTGGEWEREILYSKLDIVCHYRPRGLE